MKRSQLIDALAARFEGNKKAAGDALDAVIDTITREVARGEKVVIKGFGTFEKVLPKKSAVKKSAKGGKKKRSFVPRFSAAKELSGVVSGAIKLPKLPHGRVVSLESVKEAVGKEAAPVGTPAEPTAAPAPVKKTPVKKAAATKAAAKKAPAKKATPATSGSGAEKAAPAAAGSPAKKATPATSASPAKKAPAKKAPAKRAASKAAAAKKTSTAKKATRAAKKSATPPAPGSAAQADPTSPTTPPTPES